MPDIRGIPANISDKQRQLQQAMTMIDGALTQIEETEKIIKIAEEALAKDPLIRTQGALRRAQQIRLMGQFLSLRSR